MFEVQHFTSLFLKFKSNLAVKRFLFLFNADFDKAILKYPDTRQNLWKSEWIFWIREKEVTETTTIWIL